MESSRSVTEQSAEVPVSFVRDDALVPEPKARIPTTDEQGRAPRNAGSRRIDFVDDGKLFEGHFTVQATNLKSIIQYLLDRHNEQDVIIQDLQKQVHTLRTRSLKSSKRSGGGGAESSGLIAGMSSLGGAASASELNKRLKRVEQFLQLWGVQLSDVAELVEEHGDPTITPDAYTSYLLDLPAFRLTRREARALMAVAGQPTAASTNAAAASDTATRRRTSSAKRDVVSSSAVANAAPAQEERPRSVTPEKRTRKANDGDGVAEATLEKATAALEKVELLMAELHNAPPRAPASIPAPKMRRAEPAAKAASASGTVDAEARADIEELGDYVMQRFDELEARTEMAVRSSALATQRERSVSKQVGESGRGGEGASKKSTGASSAHSPQPRSTATSGGRSEEVVDAIAREDAAASLDLLEELETTMERRFKELSSAVANINARTAALAKSSSSSNNNSDTDKAQRRTASPATAARSALQPAVEAGKKAKEQNTAAAEDGGDVVDSRAPSPANSRAPSAPSKKNGTPGRKGITGSNETSALIPVLPAALATLVDQTARDDAVALTERVNDLEEELLDRWQAMEERLRIIGRAAMKQGITNAAGNVGGASSMSRAPAVDRKAREDAAMSLMRLHQVEKELAQLKRSVAAAPSHAGLASEGGGTVTQTIAMAPPDLVGPLRDTYGSKVASLEREVEQRMAEVNQAIAQLRGTGSTTPLALSPQKGAKDRAPVAPVPAYSSTALEPTSAAPPPPTNQLTLRSGEGDILSLAEAEAAAAGTAPVASREAENRRRAAQQTVLDLGYDIDGNANFTSEFPRTSVRVDGRRTTISRLRSPDVPPFGSHLVQREVVDIPLFTGTTAAGEDTLGNAAQRGEAATPVPTARRISNVKGDAVHHDGQRHSVSPPRGSTVGGIAARVSVS